MAFCTLVVTKAFYSGSWQLELFKFRAKAVGSVVTETRKTVWDILHPTHVKSKYSAEEWYGIDEHDEHRWKFLCCTLTGCIF
jgi:hypothetical protein